MNLIIDCEITANKKHLGFARKEIESNLLPYVDLEIEDSAWKETRKVLSVTVNFQQNYVHVNIEGYDILNEKKYDDIKSMFEGHGWQVI